MFKDKKVLVVGMARSGIAAAELLVKHGALVTINDSKTLEVLQDDLSTILHTTQHDFGGPPKDLHTYDLMVMSPGIPKDLPFVQEAQKINLKILGALEIGYLYSKGTFYGITGTNGKTTTTTLTYDIFKEAGKDVYAVGNIGTPVAAVADLTTSESHLVTEVSSFQLESTEQFRVHIAAVLNITPDHLNRHKTMAAYVEAKCRIIENQIPGDYLILNYDDEPTRTLVLNHPNTEVLYFSKQPLEKGFYIKNNIVYAHINTPVAIMSVDDIKIPGQHSLENVLAAVGIAHLSGVSPENIKNAVKAFRGVEHRIEYVGTFNGVICYNDSKATNPEAAIVAVTSMSKPTVLIAGGMDKGSVFDAFIDTFDSKIKHLILLGETKEVINQTALDKGFSEITLVNDMEEAVEKALEIAKPGDAILLSPACASWDMYPSFEVRGEHFKSCLLKKQI